jgi:hypothetical protein
VNSLRYYRSSAPVVITPTNGRQVTIAIVAIVRYTCRSEHIQGGHGMEFEKQRNLLPAITLIGALLLISGLAGVIREPVHLWQ